MILIGLKKRDSVQKLPEKKSTNESQQPRQQKSKERQRRQPRAAKAQEVFTKSLRSDDGDVRPTIWEIRDGAGVAHTE